VPNKVGIGLGHKLFGVPKDIHQEYFGDYDPDARIMSIDGRFAVIFLMPVALPNAAEVSRRVAKYEFIFEERLAPLEREQLWWNESGHAKTSWLMPFVGENILALVPLMNRIASGPSHLEKLSEEIRKLVRKRIKAKQQCTDLVLALYGVILAQSLVITLRFETGHPHELAPFVDMKQLATLGMSFEGTGHQRLNNIKETDVEWLVQEFGEPSNHRSTATLFESVCKAAINRYCWSQVSGPVNGPVTPSQEAEMRAWLEHQVTETWIGEDSVRKWEIEAATKSFERGRQ
jgi:hypothetical protein